jgi:cytochrome c peroxidase
MKRSKVLLVLPAAALISGACWAAAMVTVDQKQLAFSTARLAVTKGSVVAFLNGDQTSHNILIRGNGVNVSSGLQRPGVTFKAPFEKSGTYQVSCGIHPKMKMSVVVN